MTRQAKRGETTARADRSSAELPAVVAPAHGKAHERTQLAVAGFRSPPIEDMVAVGAVGARAARIWIRSARPGRLEISCEPEQGGRALAFVVDASDREDSDHTLSVELPQPGGEPLSPGRRYRFAVRRADDGRPLGTGRFETAPASASTAPQRFAFAVMSCHQPFENDGSLAAASAEMLEAAAVCLERHDAKFVLTIGDQMYTDYPPTLSLFEPEYFRRVAPRGRARINECSAAEVRSLLQQRHRLFWNVPGWRKMHAQYACYPMLDDHELVDNWGSHPAHRSPEWSEYARGARGAYFDYQGSRVSDRREPGDDFDYEIDWGPLAIYVVDLRSNRYTIDDDEASLYSGDQERRLREFLERYRERSVLGIVLSVPAVHFPRWVARVGHRVAPGNEDFSDRWSTPGHIDARDRLLWALYRHQRAHPAQRLILLSGDIHLACAHAIEWADGTRPLLQLVSSGITNQAGLAIQLLAKLSILANQKIACESGVLEARVRLLDGMPPLVENPFAKLNLGLVELERDETSRYRVRFLIYGHRDGEPACVYRSGWI